VIARDEARSGGAHAILADCGGGGRLECQVVGKVEIIIAGKGKQAAAFARDPWAILAQALGERASQTGAIEFRQFAASKIVQGPHGQLALIDADDSGAIPSRSYNFTGKVSAPRAYKQTKTAARPIPIASLHSVRCVNGIACFVGISNVEPVSTAIRPARQQLPFR
jgi:hypothetical protein